MPSILGYAIIIFAAVGGIATIAVASGQAMARQPEVRQNLQLVFILGAAFCESLGLFGFLLALLAG
ncbi:MAG: ATPase [Coriobacteriia bacterium]|nr:ATPase [Coriobacteriia bacterium]